jgi:hypothetical protein
MNITELNITCLSIRRSSLWSASTLLPEMSETYPGTSGNTQGDRKDRTPATKAAIGSGKLDIKTILRETRDELLDENLFTAESAETAEETIHHRGDLRIKN